MEEKFCNSIVAHFSALPDPRIFLSFRAIVHRRRKGCKEIIFSLAVEKNSKGKDALHYCNNRLPTPCRRELQLPITTNGFWFIGGTPPVPGNENRECNSLLQKGHSRPETISNRFLLPFFHRALQDWLAVG